MKEEGQDKEPVKDNEKFRCIDLTNTEDIDVLVQECATAMYQVFKAKNLQNHIVMSANINGERFQLSLIKIIDKKLEIK